MPNNDSEALSVSLCQVDQRGSRRQDYSVEELLAKRKNTWRDWLCAAGSENLHITADGDAYTASCRVGGQIGNVFRNELAQPVDWIRCTKNWCMCGADMQIRKIRHTAFRARAKEPLPTRVQVVEEADWVVPAHGSAHRHYPKSITWDLSRRCNYTCSYCHPSVSNHTDRHRTWEELSRAAELILSRFCRSGTGPTPAKWIFTGGEPTLNPSFVDLVDLLIENGQLVHVQSNGSRGPEYFAQLSKKACVGLSLHMEGFNKSKFFATVAAILEKRADQYWFGVRIMVPPGRLSEALEIRSGLLALPRAAAGVVISLSPLYERFAQDQLQSYRADELELIQRHTEDRSGALLSESADTR